jgi:hypothetical protein
LAFRVTKTVRGPSQSSRIPAPWKTKTPGKSHLFPGGVTQWIRYGRLTVVPSPDAEMLKVPAAVFGEYA